MPGRNRTGGPRHVPRFVGGSPPLPPWPLGQRSSPFFTNLGRQSDNHSGSFYSGRLAALDPTSRLRSNRTPGPGTNNRRSIGNSLALGRPPSGQSLQRLPRFQRHFGLG